MIIELIRKIARRHRRVDSRVKEVFLAAMKIAQARGKRMTLQNGDGVVEFLSATAGGFQIDYVPESPVEAAYVQVRRATQQLAMLSFDPRFDAYHAFPLLPGPWQDALIRQADAIAARPLHS